MKAGAEEEEEEEGEKRRGLGACVSDKSPPPPPVSLLPSVPAYYTMKNFEELTQCFEIRRLATKCFSIKRHEMSGTERKTNSCFKL